ncbi:unnamed protein product [Lampetra fluviatilis]
MADATRHRRDPPRPGTAATPRDPPRPVTWHRGGSPGGNSNQGRGADRTRGSAACEGFIRSACWRPAVLGASSLEADSASHEIPGRAHRHLGGNGGRDPGLTQEAFLASRVERDMRRRSHISNIPRRGLARRLHSGGSKGRVAPPGRVAVAGCRVGGGKSLSSP